MPPKRHATVKPPPPPMSEEEALKFARSLTRQELAKDGIIVDDVPASGGAASVGASAAAAAAGGGVQQVRTVMGASQDARRLGIGLFNSMQSPSIVTTHGVKIFGGAVVFCIASIYYFSGMTVEARYADGKRVCVNCKDQKDAAQRRWFAPPTIPEPPDLPDAFKKTKLIS